MLPGDRSCAVRNEAEVVPWGYKREGVHEEERVWERKGSHVGGKREAELVVGRIDVGSIVVGHDEDRDLVGGGDLGSDRSLDFCLCFCRICFDDLFSVCQGEALQWPQ